MLDVSQRSQLDIRRDGTPRTSTVNAVLTKGCTWITAGDYGYNAQTIPVDATLALTESDAVPITVNGFGAVRSIPQSPLSGAPTCQITIDAGPQQVIRVQAQVVPRPPLPSDDELCRRATDTASMIMTTVVERSR